MNDKKFLIHYIKTQIKNIFCYKININPYINNAIARMLECTSNLWGGHLEKSKTH